jgi:hypothetical protein
LKLIWTRFYCSKHCIGTVDAIIAATLTPGVLWQWIVMFVPIVASSKECLYEEVSLQMDTMFHNTPLCTFEPMYFWCQTPPKTLWGKYEECTLIILQKPSGKNEGFNFWYAVKNSYNLVGQIRRNTFSIYHVFHISFIKTLMGKIKRSTYSCVHIASLKAFHEKFSQNS